MFAFEAACYKGFKVDLTVTVTPPSTYNIPEKEFTKTITFSRSAANKIWFFYDEGEYARASTRDEEIFVYAWAEISTCDGEDYYQ